MNTHFIADADTFGYIAKLYCDNAALENENSLSIRSQCKKMLRQAAASYRPDIFRKALGQMTEPVALIIRTFIRPPSTSLSTGFFAKKHKRDDDHTVITESKVRRRMDESR